MTRLCAGGCLLRGVTCFTGNFQHGKMSRLIFPTPQADDEIDKPYLEGFEWMPAHHEYSEKEQEQKEADWQRLYVHLTATPTLANIGGGGKKKKSKE